MAILPMPIFSSFSSSRRACSLLLRWSAMASLLTFFSTAQAAQVSVAVDWSALTGAVATPLHYGLNAFHAYNPAISGTPGNANYKANTAYMKPGIVRLHNGDQALASTNPRGWVINPTTADYRWDETKIDNALKGSFPFGPTLMMTIVEWPAFLRVSSTDQRLAPAHYGDFAAFCAELVRIVNLRQGRGVRYWEISNERESHGYWSTMDEVARIYAQAVAAMKAVDPTIKVGGAAFGSPEVKDHLNKFIGTVRDLGAPLDFVSYHSYPNFNGDTAPVYDTPDSVVWDQASALAAITTGVRNVIASYYPDPDAIELFQDEYNINWRINFSLSPSYDPRMNNIKGAVWDALAMVAFVQARATGAMAWNDADQAFGKLANGTYAPRPAAHLYHLFNRQLTGAVVSASSTDASKITTLAVREGTQRRFALINRSGSSQTVKLAFAGWKGVPAPEAKFTLSQITATGMVTITVPLSSLSQEPGLLIPADSVSVLTTDETVLPAPFVSHDIGAVSAPGSASYDGAVFTLRGAGANIAGTSDQGHFVGAPWSNDGELTVRVTHVDPTNPAAKAGLMVRASALPGSPEVSLLLTPGSGISFRRRAVEGGNTTITTVLSGAQVPVPFNRLKLVRSGSNYSAYYSSDGVNWTLIGSDTVNWGPGGLTGMAVNSVAPDQLCTATFADFHLPN